MRINQSVESTRALPGKLWTPADDKRLRQYYENTDPAAFSLDVISAELGRTRYAVSIRAGRKGLSAPGRPPNDATKRALSKAKKGLPGTNRGRKFGPRSEEWKKQNSERAKRNWKHWKETGTGLMAEHHVQRKSDSMSKLQTSGRMRNGNSRFRSGFREDIGIFVRSSWEANIARYLNWMKSVGVIEEWSYEKDTFWFEHIKRGCRSYTPDFKIKFRGDDTPVYWEVKGWMDAKSHTKLKRMELYYPHIKLILVGAKEYKELKKQAGSLLGWE